MNHDNPFRESSLPEMLAALADGELPAADCARVEAWLKANAAAIEELKSQKRFGWHTTNLWRCTASELPSDSVWNSVIERVRAAVLAPRPTVAPAGRVSRRRLLMAISSIAAAAVFAFLWFPQNTGHNGGGGARNADALAVASADDVEILRILEVDVDRLVIGEPPLGRPIVLASVEDIDGLRIAKDTDGMMPKVSMVPAIGAPMIVAPMAGK